MRRAVLLLLAVFAALAVAVGLGAFTWLDQGAVDHLMPGLAPRSDDTSLADVLLPLTEYRGVWDAIADVWLYPASVLVSGALIALCRSRLLLGAWFVGTAIEVVVKATLARPDVHQGARHLVDFDQSLPSGHTIRSLLVAAAVARAFPRLARWAWGWAASVWILLVVQGWHVPTDVAGGLLLASALVLLADDLERRRVDRSPHRARAEHVEPAVRQP
jgi:membrane-associated phospholipid phosphatase